MPEFREAKSPAPRAASAPSKRCHAGISRSEISGTQSCRHTAGQVVALGPGCGLTPEAGMTTNAAYLTLSCRNFAKRNLRHPELQTHRRTGCDPRSRLSG